MVTTMPANDMRVSQTRTHYWTLTLQLHQIRLCRSSEHRSGGLRNTKRGEFRLSDAISRNFFNTASAAEVAALADRAKRVTLWRVEGPHDAQMQGVLALREVPVMKSYRPRLLDASTAAARIRSEIFDVLVQTGR